MADDHPTDNPLDNVTRFELIDHRPPFLAAPRGRVFSTHNVKVELSYQDDGRTLKVFVTSRAAGAS